jgi:HEAT repeat protein
MFAIALAPLSEPQIRAAVVKAQKDSDEVVRHSALEKWIQTSPSAGGPPEGSAERKAVVQQLLGVARGSSPSARAAKVALAGAGVNEVIPILVKDMDSSLGLIRRAAGSALAVLGELPRAVILTADPDPEVRAAVACAILREGS